MIISIILNFTSWLYKIFVTKNYALMRQNHFPVQFFFHSGAAGLF